MCQLTWIDTLGIEAVKLRAKSNCIGTVTKKKLNLIEALCAFTGGLVT